LQSSVLLFLLGLSVVAWIFTYVGWAQVQRLWYLSGAKKFHKQPNLDVGAVFLLFCANLAVLSLLAYRLFDTDPMQNDSSTKSEASAKLSESKPEPATSTPSTASTPSITSKANSKLAEPPANAVSASKSQTPTQFVITLLLGALVVGVMMLTSRWFYGTTLYSWGWGPVMEGKIGTTLAASCLAFFLLVPPVILVHELLSTLIAYQHETIHSVRQLRADGAWVAIVVSFLYTVGWTPFVEELMFRVLLQGFAEQLVTHRKNFLRWVLGPLKSGPAKFFGVEHAASVANQNWGSGLGKNGWGSWQFWTPIVVSGLPFAMAHVGQGAAPVALYLFAIGLGFLYKTTGNFWLCVLIHAYLNGLTMTLLLLRPE
jgi:membrane protease YdiL (CAAX protease family)